MPVAVVGVRAKEIHIHAYTFTDTHDSTVYFCFWSLTCASDPRRVSAGAVGGRDADGVDADDDAAAAAVEEAEAASPPNAGSGGSSGSGEPRAPTECGACNCCCRCCESVPPNGVSGGTIGGLAENREAPPALAPAPALATAAPALSVRLGCPRSSPGLSPRPPKTLPALVLDWARLGMREPVAPAPPADERTTAVSLRGPMVGCRQESGAKNKI